MAFEQLMGGAKNNAYDALVNAKAGAENTLKQRALAFAQLLMEASGNEGTPTYQDTQDLAKQYQQNMDKSGVSGLVGGMVVDPLTWATMPLAAGKGLAGALQVGGVSGLAGGGLTPVAEGENRLANTYLGGTVGAGLGAGVYGVGKAVTSPLVQKLMEDEFGGVDLNRIAWRFYGDDPMSDWGHAMFKLGDPHQNDHYGKNLYLMNLDKIPSEEQVYAGSSNFKKEMYKTLRKDKNLDFNRWNYTPNERRLEIKNAIKEMNPDDIVNYAGEWDANYLGASPYENYFHPKGLDVLETQDGAIAFSPKHIKKAEGYFDEMGLPDRKPEESWSDFLQRIADMAYPEESVGAK